MKIQCENCATQHELDPPAWVVSSGRAFRFRCSSCGHSQSVQPAFEDEEEPAPTETPSEELVVPEAPLPKPPVEATPLLGPASPTTLPPFRGVEQAGNDAVFLKQHGQIYMVRDWDTLRRWIEERRVDKHDLVSEGGVRWEPIGSRADLATHFQSGSETPAPVEAEPEETPAPTPPTPAPAPSFPFGEAGIGGETPFGSSEQPSAASNVWHDDDTEGIPTGLPPLPTDELYGETDTESRPYDLTMDEPAPPALLDSIPPSSGERPNSPVVPNLAAVAPHISAPRPNLAAHFTDEEPDEPMPAPSATPMPAPPSLKGTWEDLLVHGEESAEEPIEGITEAATAPPALEVRRSEPTIAVAEDESTTSAPIAPGEPEATAPDWDEPPVSSSTGSNALYAVLAVASIGVALLGGWALINLGSSAIVVPEPADAIQATTVEPPDPPDPEPAPEPEPEPEPEPAPEPEPEPEPAPEPPPAPKGPTMAQLIAAGWGRADNDPAAAARTFKRVLNKNPNNFEAHYGYGYAQLKAGNKDDARTHLCRAATSPDVGVQREVGGLMRANGITCD